MGRTPDPVRRHFQKLDQRSNNHGEFFHRCLHCIRAQKEAESANRTPVVVSKIHGSKTALRRHLDGCPYTPEARMARAALEMTSGLHHHHQEDHSATLSVTPQPPSKADIDSMLTDLLEFQADNRLPDSFIERPSTLRFAGSLGRLGPAAVNHLPGRRTLGGPMLNKYAEKVATEEGEEVRDKQNRTGGRVNFLSDVWQNITKKHLLGCQLALYGSVTTFGLFPTDSSHDGFTLAKQMEGIMIDAESKGWKIGAAVTDDASQCSRARRILALRWPDVVFLKCFAHDINNLVKSILSSPTFCSVTTQAQKAVKTLNASSAKWLKRAQDMMIQTYGGEWKLFDLCTTRWNSMQRCFASLLRVQTALRLFAVKYRDDKEFPKACSVFEKETFWSSLQDAEQVTSPLCFASFKLQSEENTLADVVIVLRDLYEKFQRSVYRDELTKLVEARWAMCEQPLFMLALYLHPAYYKDAAKLSTTMVTGLENITDIAEYYCKKLLRCDSEALVGEMTDWLSGQFVKKEKTLDNFVNSALPPLAAYWEYMQRIKPTSTLPKLALTIFSITVNTATCERYFSELALIHTALRNRMDAEKATKIAAVRSHVRKTSGKQIVLESPAKRLVPTTEPDRVLAFGSPERRSSASRNNVAVHSSETLPEDADDLIDEEDDSECDADVDCVTYWEQILSVMNASDEDTQVTALLESMTRTIGAGAENAEEAEEIPLQRAERRPFPEDATQCPQESVALRGLRGRKVKLSEFNILTL